MAGHYERYGHFMAFSSYIIPTLLIVVTISVMEVVSCRRNRDIQGWFYDVHCTWCVTVNVNEIVNVIVYG